MQEKTLDLEKVRKRLGGRYRDGYRVSKAVNSIGGVIKFIGVVVILVSPFIILMGVGQRDESDRYLIITLGALGMVIGIVLWVFGVLISAVGQIHLAVLDTSVHTSTLLTDEDKGQILSGSVEG